ncbi:MAG: hypothetical protein MJB57_01010 [Gemmatimonadetes bacterium]|nr:hypothetical protein [Gemmatimonadota bacterium]
MARQKAKKKPVRRSVKNHPRYAALREYKGGTLELESLGLLGAHSVGIGRKCERGEAKNSLAIRYYVPKKRPMSRLTSGEQIPKTVEFFSRRRRKNVRLNTDVIEMPPAQLEQFDPEQRVRPVVGGVSGGPPSATGTIGGWVWDATDETIVMLSNHHVFGDTPGVDIMQQGPGDGGSLPADRIGHVKRGIRRSKSTPNRVDAAIGDPESRDLVSPEVAEVGPGVHAIEAPTIDLLVEKYGQTTRHTFGEIADNDWSGMVGGRPFVDCVMLDPSPPSNDWSAGGDSGSLVFSQTADAGGVKPVVGLHFAGAGTRGIACKIHNVFSALNLTTLSTGAFSTFLDGIFEAETTGAVTLDTEDRLRAVSALATQPLRWFSTRPFIRPEWEMPRAGSFFCGISRDVEARVRTTPKGRRVGSFVDRNRGELFRLLLHDGDVRRATTAALRPIVAGAVTTTDVLERVLTPEDLDALDKVRRELESKGSDGLKQSLKPLDSLRTGAEGRSIAEILGITL